MRWIVGSSLKFRYIVIFIAAALVFFGTTQLRDMPVDVFPEFAPPRVEIQTPALGLSAAEVESLVTIPLEEQLTGIPGVDVMRSKSVQQLSSVLLIFEPGTDLMLARQLVQERLATATTNTIPPDVGPPIMLQPLSSTSRIMKIGLTSEELSLRELSMTAYWKIRARLLGVPGVANVAIWGERLQMYQVQVEPGTGEIWATDCRFWQPRASAAHDSGSEVVYKYRVMQPLTAMLYKSSSRAGELDAIALFLQPLDDEHVIAHTLLACYDDTSTDAELIAFQQTIFGQDKPILENHAFKRMPLEGRAETPTRGDTTSVTYRRWLRERGMRFGVREAA